MKQRPLEAMYPVVYFDALCLKIHDEDTVRNKAVDLALSIRADGKKDWKIPPVTWKQAANQFAILFGERFKSALH